MLINLNVLPTTKMITGIIIFTMSMILLIIMGFFLPYFNGTGFLRKKEHEILKNSKNAIKLFETEWKKFLKKDTYLIYDDKIDFQDLVRKGQNKTKIPWYFFWNSKLKSNLQFNLEQLRDYEGKILIYNLNFIIQRKIKYKDLFKKHDLTLDDDQQTAIITDDKHNLVVAGAGSGKTEVLITRIAYLIKRKDDIRPKRILALAFQTKAANEMKERLKKRYNIDVEIRTFHSLGNKILKDTSKIKGLKAPKLEYETDRKYQIYIQSLFNKESAKNKTFQNTIVNFMKHFEDDEVIKEKTDFKKKEEFYKYQRNLTYTALDGTKVKSEAERKIMNFFIIHNLNGKRIKIIYENPANWMKYKKEDGTDYIPKPDFYFPEYDLYLEHWAIGKNGKVPEWFSGDNPTKEYTKNMNIKKEKYKLNEKTLFETSQADYENGNFHEILKERFITALKQTKPNEEFNLENISYEELVKRVWNDCKEFVKKISMNISRFVVIAKTYRLYPQDIEKRLKNEKWSKKQIAFAKIANTIYNKYQKGLEKNNYIDFSDMINKAVDYLRKYKKLYNNEYDHILVDEFQDISAQRYELINELMNKNSKCKLFCVGDDWQSIMGFAGSNLDYFINFKKYFPHPVRTDLTKNYRSIKSVVNVGAHIIKHNKGQILKKTIPGNPKLKETERPIMVYSSNKYQYLKYYEQIAKNCLEKINEMHKKGCSYDDFLVLMRIASENKMIWRFIIDYAKKLRIPIITESHKEVPNRVKFMSVHRSKGLQAKVVIVLNVDKGLYGFPCELENPDIFMPAIENNDGLREEEERRLFYVAVTRAKEEVIMYTQKGSESKFVTEIKDFIKREEL